MHAHPNRLTIAHLLLWTATTGVALAYLLEQRPPPAKSIFFASFITQAGQDAEAEMAKAQQKIHRRWQTNYQIGLAASPVYGAALAGAVLATWRVVTWRFGFPVQPGHWLLLMISSLSLLLVIHPSMQRLLQSQDAPDFMMATVMAGIVAGVIIMIGEPRWRCALGLGATGFGLLSLAYIASLSSAPIEPPGLIVVGVLAVAAFPVAALICTAADIAERGRFDLFHWIGVATLFGTVTHVLIVRA